jgi:hypothetical protein
MHLSTSQLLESPLLLLLLQLLLALPPPSVIDAVR